MIEVATVAVGIATGLASALFGIGGGIVMVPFMVLVLGSPQHVAEGTSLLVIVPTTIAGLVAHRKGRYVELHDAVALGGGGVCGAVAGALLAQEIDPGALRTLFAALVFVVGARMIFQGLRREDDAHTGQ